MASHPLSTAVRKARKARPLGLAPHLPRDGAGPAGGRYRVALVHVKDLTPEAREDIWTLFDENMAGVSAGTSLAYTKPDKLAELFDPLSRFVLVNEQTDTDGPLLAFASFRFDMEDTADSLEYTDEPLAEVLYVYEMQVSPSARGAGLGRILVDECMAVADKAGMQKVILTCLKANEAALRFYRRLGFEPDEIDPTRNILLEAAETAGGRTKAVDEAWDGEQADTHPGAPDYRILSRAVQARPR